MPRPRHRFPRCPTQPSPRRDREAGGFDGARETEESSPETDESSRATEEFPRGTEGPSEEVEISEVVIEVEKKEVQAGRGERPEAVQQRCEAWFDDIFTDYEFH
jgi:hypothetical protein